MACWVTLILFLQNNYCSHDIIYSWLLGIYSSSDRILAKLKGPDLFISFFELYFSSSKLILANSNGKSWGWNYSSYSPSLTLYCFAYLTWRGLIFWSFCLRILDNSRVWKFWFSLLYSAFRKSDWRSSSIFWRRILLGSASSKQREMNSLNYWLYNS